MGFRMLKEGRILGYIKIVKYFTRYPWMVCGDFNKILYSFEKVKGVTQDERQMDMFREALEECQLMDLGYSRTWYTWKRGNLPETIY